MAASALLLGAFAADAEETQHIVAIGDSITAGGKLGVKEYTYRWPLARMLKDEQACFDFVGVRRTGLDANAPWPQAWDSDNEGYYGARTAAVRDRLVSDLPKVPPPDIALIHLGTNDSDGFVEDDIVQPLEQIIEMLRSRNPKVVVLVAKISGPRNVRTAYLHLRTGMLARRWSTAESPVVAVDQASGWDAAQDTFDGVHPNLKGQRKMAERWLDALQPFLKRDADRCRG